MTGFLLTLFSWPSGIVVGNLIASAMWASVFEWRLRVHHRKIHAHIMAAARPGKAEKSE